MIHNRALIGSDNDAPVVASGDLNRARRADWLLSTYSDAIWTVCNPSDPDEQLVIDFRLIMPDGKLLTAHNNLYATVKEFAWWFRDPRFRRVERLESYVMRVNTMMYIAHGVSLRGIDCFSKILPLDIEDITEDCVMGVLGLVKACERIESFLAKTPIECLPIIGEKSRSRLDRMEVLRLARIPPIVRITPIVAFVFDKYCVEHNHKIRRPLCATPPVVKPTSYQRLSQFLTTFELLRGMSTYMEAKTITFKPYVDGAARVAAVKGGEAARTPTAPPNLALKLLESAIVWIADHQAKATTLRADALRLATACWIVIAAFSARRVSEIASLEAGCMHGSNDDGWWLNIKIVKTLQRKDLVPVPAIVTKAIDSLEALSAEARLATGENKLFQWRDPSTGMIVELNCGRHIDAFADVVSIPDHLSEKGVGVRWHWTPHQFRRFFAILYFWRFESAEIEALSHHLRHFNLEMTRRYIIEDSEVAGIWHDVEWGFRSHIARAIVTGERTVSGSMGKRLRQLAQRLKDQLHKKLKVVRPEQAEAILIDATSASLSMAMGRQKLVLTPKPWVTCSCPQTPNAARKAACRQGALAVGQTGPDFANAGPTVCSSCPWAIVEKNKASYVTLERDGLAARQQSAPPGTILAQLEAERLFGIQQVLDTRYGAAEA